MTNASQPSTNLSLAPAGLVTDEIFTYRYLPADGSIDNIARRFEVEVTAIWRLNGRTMSWQPAPGEILQIPRPAEDKTQDGRAWEQYDVTESCPLKDLLERLSEGGLLSVIGSGGGNGNVGDDEALKIWRYWRNARLREDVLVRSPDAVGGDQRLAGLTDSEEVARAGALPGKDVVEINGPKAAVLEEGDAIFLPFTPLAHTTIAVAPDATATVDLTQTPLVRVRRRLSGIHDILEHLIGIRAEANRVRAECTGDMRILHQLRALVQAEQAQYDSVAYRRLHPDADDGGRAAVIAALDRLIDQATPRLLHAPLRVVAPSVLAQWNYYMKALRAALCLPELRQELDVVIPQSGEVHCYLDGIRDAKSFVETVYGLAAQAAYWLAEDGSSESVALLDAAVSVMSSGAKASAGMTKSLVDYAAALPARGNVWSSSCAGDAAVGYCGLIVNLHLAGGLTLSAPDLSALAAKVNQAVKSMLGVDLDVYAAEEPEGHSSSVEDSGYAASKRLWSGTKSVLAKAREASGEAKAIKSGAEVELAEMDRLLSLFFEVPEAPEKLLGKLGGPIGKLRSIWQVARKIASTNAPVAGVANEGAAAGPASEEDQLLGLLESARKGAETAASVIESLKKTGALRKLAAEEGAAVVGRVTLVLSIVLELAEARNAFSAARWKEGGGHLLQGVGFLCLVPGTNLMILIGAAALIAGFAIASSPEFFKFQTGADQFFREKLAHFRLQADKFVQLVPFIQAVEGPLTDKTLPVLDAAKFKAYAPLLEGAGLAATDVVG